MMKGRSAIQAFWKGAAEQIGDGKLTTVEVKPLGDEVARELGTFTVRTDGAQPPEVTGKYVVIWEKVGGDWKPVTSGILTSLQLGRGLQSARITPGAI
jgi:ketosteroid isomerase-like protein